MLSPAYLEPVPPMVSPYTMGWGFVDEATVNSSPISSSWESANRGVWIPIYVPTVCVAKRMWWANGATVSGSYNVEAGIYLDAGHKPGAKLITTGSVAQGTASEVQFSDITDTTLTPQLYWLYMSCSTTSATFARGTLQTASWDELFRFQQASIGPGSAPSTATPAEGAGQSIYLMGFSTTTIT
jgi:hypothetical protein